jgi:hypothetical protein
MEYLVCPLLMRDHFHGKFFFSTIPIKRLDQKSNDLWLLFLWIKYSYEFKIEVVNTYLSGEGNFIMLKIFYTRFKRLNKIRMDRTGDSLWVITSTNCMEKSRMKGKKNHLFGLKMT